jgi:hypothetical protein
VSAEQSWPPTICPDCGKTVQGLAMNSPKQPDDPLPKLWPCGHTAPPKPTIVDAESRGRAAGWREAIAALRDTDDFASWSRAGGRAVVNEHGGIRTTTALVARYLESLAPKETP